VTTLATRSRNHRAMRSADVGWCGLEFGSADPAVQAVLAADSTPPNTSSRTHASRSPTGCQPCRSAGRGSGRRRTSWAERSPAKWWSVSSSWTCSLASRWVSVYWRRALIPELSCRMPLASPPAHVVDARLDVLSPCQWGRVSGRPVGIDVERVSADAICLGCDSAAWAGGSLSCRKQHGGKRAPSDKHNDNDSDDASAATRPHCCRRRLDRSTDSSVNPTGAMKLGRWGAVGRAG
jgi:hypothetical protein